MSSTGVDAVRVFVLPATALNPGPRSTYAFPWSLGFVEEKRLIPQRCADVPGGMGDASFRLLRIAREENGVAASTTHNVVSGAYCCITRGMGETFDSSTAGLALVDWWGWIASVDGDQVKGTTDLFGSVTARGLGHLLDGTVLTGFRKAVSGSGQYPAPINTPPTANFSLVEGLVTGNAKLTRGSSDTGQFGGLVFAFAPLPANCGTFPEQFWTRWRLLLHILAYCRPPTLPVIRVVCADGSELFDPTYAAGLTNNIAQTLNDTSVPEVFDLRDLTLKGALDMLIPRSRGFGWQIQPKNGSALSPPLTAGYWELVIFTYDADGSYAPQNPAINVDLSALTDIKAVQVAKSNEDEYDEIAVQGEPIVFAATIGVPDGNLAPGWTADQEQTYLDGAKNETGDGGYASWTDPNKKTLRNNLIRQSPLLERVFTTFGLYAIDSSEDVQRKVTPGAGTGASVPLVGHVNWNGTACYVTDTPSHVPYLPTARLLRTIPWPVGVAADAVDSRDSAQKANPDYWPLRLFRYISGASTGGLAADPYDWLDLLVKHSGDHASSHRGTPSVEPDDRSPGIRVKYNPPEILAVDHWTGTPGRSSLEDGTPGLSPGGTPPNPLCMPYSSLVATVAIASDQRLEVVITKPGLSAGSPGYPSAQARRRLVIRDSRLHCWFVPDGTILAIKADGEPDRVRAGATGARAFARDSGGTGDPGRGYLVRNDYPLAQRIATMTAAWAFQRRTSITIVRALTDATVTWDGIGAMIGTVTEAAGVDLVVNTVVERIEIDYSIESPSMTVQTTLPARPDLTWKIGGGVSPMSGGAVSVSGGGTLAQQIQDAKQAVHAVASEQRRVPLIPAWHPGDIKAQFIEVLIDRGNTLADGSLGIKYSYGGVGSVPSAYDPNVTSSFIDGIGRGTLFIDGAVQTGYVLVVLDSNSPIAYALKTGEYVATPTTIQIPVDGTMPVEYVTAYVPVWV